LICALLCSTRSAHAEAPTEATRTAASTLGYAGVEAFQAGDFVSASQQLEHAYALLNVPSLGLWSARALVETGQLVRASERYRAVVSLKVAVGDAAIQKSAQADAARELAELTPRIPRVQITTSGAPATDVSVSVDGAPVASVGSGEPLALDPGRRLIEGRRGEQTVQRELVLEERQQVAVVLRFVEAPPALAEASPAATTPLRTLGWGAVALGGAGFAAGAAIAISLFADREHFASSASCDVDRNTCGRELSERVDAYNTKRVVSSVGLIAGGVMALAGGYLVIFHTAPQRESPRLSLRLTSDSLALQGQF
jgi:hypothetical protein